MSSSEIVPVVGKEYRVSQNGENWVTRVFLYTTVLGAHVCQQKRGYLNGDLPILCRAYTHIKEIPVIVEHTKVLDPLSILQELVSYGYEVDSQGDWRKHGKQTFAAGMWFYCGCPPASLWNWEPEWLRKYFTEE